MNSLSRRRFFGSVAAAAATAASGPTVLIKRAHAAPTLVPRKMPFPPNDNFGNYEPAISADGNTIHFARFANNGDTRVKGPTDIFVTHRVGQSGEWPGTAGDWSPGESACPKPSTAIASTRSRGSHPTAIPCTL
jgi:hypothetical protein